ncbi:MAG: NAD(P)/FAD-dependent oxidoreductase [candidate division KSB1 bacterium]|nr:NAD(P)/FAD-dependent oxidoreductase [candidate division KSB1 bacterium]
MFGKSHPDVVVVGAGPVGLFTALNLAHRDVSVMIVDKDWRRAAHSYALGLHVMSLRLLKDLGLFDEVVQHGRKIQKVEIFDQSDKRAEINLEEIDPDIPYLITMEQARLEEILETALNKKGIKVLWNHEVSHLQQLDDGVEVGIDKLEKISLGYAIAHTEWVVAKSEKVKVPLVIGADGHRSFVRRILQIPFEMVGDTQHFAVFEFKCRQALDYEMRLDLTQDTMNVLWPLPDQFCRWSFEIKEEVHDEESRQKERQAISMASSPFPALSMERFHQLLKERASWFTAEPEEISWRIVVRFEKRLADRFGQGRVWLAGDAVHMTSPAGIQSMNIGFREAAMLTDLIYDHLKQGSSLDRFAEYNQQFVSEWRMINGMDDRVRSGVSQNPWLVENKARILSSLPASGEHLLSMLSQLGFDMK